MILYHLSFKQDSLLIKILEAGSSRILYYDTLIALAVDADRDLIAFLKKIHTRFSKNLDTLSFQWVEAASSDIAEALRLLAPTGRTFYQLQPLRCDWSRKVEIYWKGQGEKFSACFSYLGHEIPLEACEKLFPSWALWKGSAFPIAYSLSWKWVELFAKGPLLLEGIKKKRFLEEAPPIVWSQENQPAQLFLTDMSGSFANLGPESLSWEADLLEAGFLRKTVGNSHYFCPTDKLFSTLLFLLEIGWEIFDFRGRRLFKQSSSHFDVTQEKDKIALRGEIDFQEKKVSFRAVMEAVQKKKMWVDIDASSVALLDWKKEEVFSGEWIEEALYIKKEESGSLVSFLDHPSVVWEESLVQMVRGLREGSTVEGSLPGPFFQGELLMHQQKGLDWLLFLYRHRFSALLADEMGLGKTVQVLAFFSCLRTNLPVLIAAPTSLIYNWRSEMSRFLPSFPVYLHMGADRLSQVSDLKEHRFIITSYAILRLDEELLSQVEWEVIVLDESGAIKTAATQTARAAYGLKSRFRICLNGTPVENRSDELWSQFRFLLPHLTPTARTIKPFILRRKKDELDLPEKIEQTVWISMSDAQSALYDSYLKGVQTNLLKKETLNRMEILEAILRLRQICVDPRLLGSKDPGEKLERVLADIEEALFEKRKVLIYSQFTSALQLLSKQLSCNFLYLDGTTAPAQRADLVRRFQEDPEASLFLLSLKAGGVGLNLTAADYVFLLDPWWNDAVENQAIDRAHRIGRKKSVMARRYLTVGTIEEKMLSLKEKKLTIAAALLDEEVSWTEEDWLHLLS